MSMIDQAETIARSATLALARQKERIAELEAALRPLATWASVLPNAPDDHHIPATVSHLSLTMAHARSAREAIDNSQ